MKFNSFLSKVGKRKEKLGSCSGCWVKHSTHLEEIMRLKKPNFGEVGEMLLTGVLASISITRIIFDGGTVPLILIQIQIQYMPLGGHSNKSIDFVYFSNRKRKK